MKTIVFIGAGNMAEALVRGILKSGFCTADRVTVTDPEASRLNLFRETYGVHGTSSNAEAIQGADIVFLAVKPQMINQVLQELDGRLTRRSLVISIAAGITTKTLESKLDRLARVIRVMPNTPALVGAGAAALCRGQHASDEDVLLAVRLMESVGVVVQTEEKMMDAVTALSGSGPAYVFYLMEAMLASAREMGLDDELARQLVFATVSGAGKLAEKSETDPAELRRRVTSKGGTTEAAIGVLENAKVGHVITEAVLAAERRSRELSGS